MSPPSVLVYEDDPAAAQSSAVAALLAGCCIVYPTDTVYGLLAHPAAAAAYREIFRLKGRSTDAPLALLAHPDCPAVPAAARALDGEPQLAAQFALGRLTVILGERQLAGIPSAVAEVQPGPVGLRCPADRRSRALLAACGGLAWATSVNLTGQPPCTLAGEVRRWLSGVDSDLLPLAVVSASEVAGAPSSVVDLTGGFPVVLR